MSKKAKLYLLVLINLLIWWYIGYKVYIALQGDEDNLSLQSSAPIQKITTTEVKDSIALSLNYPDPFLKGFHSERSSTHTSSSSQQSHHTSNTAQIVTKPVIAKTPTVATTPSIEVKYLGFIQNSDKGTQTALVSINGKSIFATKGQTIEGVLFKDITATELSVIIDKKKLVIKK